MKILIMMFNENHTDNFPFLRFALLSAPSANIVNKLIQIQAVCIKVLSLVFAYGCIMQIISQPEEHITSVL